jgi:nucleoside-diphosphate-sugar epimerase
MTKRYLVTGGAGFLGSALVKALVARGHEVRVLDDNSRGSLRRLREIDGRFEFVEGDIRDAGTVSRATRGVDGVCHLAFINGTEFFYEKPELVLEVGVKGIVHVLDACIEHRVPELLLMSSSEVYHAPPTIPTDETVPLSIPDPLNPRYSYAGGKLISELMALNYGRKRIARVLIVRPHNVFGPDMGNEHVIPQFAIRMKRIVAEHGTQGVLPFPIRGTGKESRSFVAVEDFTDGTLLVLERGEHRNVYHVGASEERTIAKVAEQVAQCYGANIEIVPGEAPRGEPPRRSPDIRKVQALGYQPRVRFADALAKTVEWYRTHDV